MIGAVLDDRYQIISLVGQGATGVVYKARHRLLNRLVAIKVLNSRLSALEDSIMRFKQEIKSVGTLSHPNIVNVYDSGITPQGAPYLVMDFLQGQSLEKILSRQGALPAAFALPLFRQSCAGLSHAHQNGIIHGSIKPGSIIVLDSITPGLPFIKIVDFGIAELLEYDRQVGLSVAQTERISGDPDYMSPEQCLGEQIDARCDVYSLGCVMYEAVSGTKPFSGKTPVAAARQLPAELNIPQALQDIVFLALQPEPGRRYQSMIEMASAIEAIEAGLPSGKTLLSQSWKLTGFAGIARRFILPVAILLAVALGTALIVKYSPGSRTKMTELLFALQTAVLPPESRELINTADKLSDLYMQQSMYRQATNRLNDLAVSLAEPRDTAGSIRLLSVYCRLVKAYCRLARTNLAQEFALKSRLLYRNLYPQLRASKDWGSLTLAQEQTRQAITSAFGADSLEAGKTLDKFGYDLMRIGDVTTAQMYFTAAEKILSKSTDADAGSELAACLESLAGASLAAKRYDLAEKQANKLYSLELKLRGPYAGATTYAMRILAIASLQQGRDLACDRLLNEAIKHDRAAGAGNLPCLIEDYKMKSYLYLKQKNYRASELALQKQLLLQKGNDDTAGTITTFEALAMVASAQGQHGKSEQFYNQALQALKLAAPYDTLRRHKLEQGRKAEKALAQTMR